jgi:hypothetical protein
MVAHEGQKTKHEQNGSEHQHCTKYWVELNKQRLNSSPTEKDRAEMKMIAINWID